jgi:hypothetical protein
VVLFILIIIKIKNLNHMSNYLKPVNSILLILLIFSLFSCGGQSNKTKKVLITPPVKDTIAPTITLIGSNIITLKRNSKYIDAGATALDNMDGDITKHIIINGDSIDTSIIGTYLINYNVTDSSQNKSVQVTRTVNIEGNYSLVEMHYDLLQNQAQIWGELDGIIELQVTKNASKGSITIKVMDTTNLMENQLITYLGEDEIYHIGQIKKIINRDEIALYKPLESSLKKGLNLWDFYDNGSHAHIHGFKAIADFSLKSLNFGKNTTGTHVLLGDSWFDDGTIHSRLIQKLPNASVINRGIGGNTTQDLLDRFDEDVTPNAPDYVWIISGTNDYWQGVSTSTFKTNLKMLIKKLHDIGAKVIIIDSSVGEGTAQSTGIKNQFQSEEYVRVTKELL